MKIAHTHMPPNPNDGDRVECEVCGATFVFVDLNDGQPGEWVDVTPPEEEW